MATLSKSTDFRQLKNKLAQYLITLGGVSVLFTLILIFMYLLYVIKPVFESAHIESVSSVTLSNQSPAVVTGLDELKEVAYEITEQGQINFYQLSTSAFREQGSLIDSQRVIQDDAAVSLVAHGNNHQVVVVDSQNQVKVVTAKFTAKYLPEGRDIAPRVDYPLGEEAIIVDEEEQALTKLAFAMDDERALFVGFTEDGRLIKTTLVAEDDFSYDWEYEAVYQTIDAQLTQVDDVAITPDLGMAVVRSGNDITIYELDDEYSVPQKAQFTPFTNEAELTSVALLSGGSSILFGSSHGVVSQWFEVAGENGRAFQEIRRFKVSDQESVSKIHTEQFRKSFYTFTPKGEMGVFYTTSAADLWRGQLIDNMPSVFAIAPRADGIMMVSEGQAKLFSVSNEHPEVTWSALWQEVWYEGYPEPDYIWQSTSGSDDFEAKFSLVPISFGTMKAALYAMLFAVPVALAAAIYTAYFMPPVLRKKVKPTIELMEALPTVILGFLAGLWLAPIIEDYLPAVALLLLFLPLSTFFAAYAWYRLPRKWKGRLPEAWAPIMLLPIIILAALAAFGLSPLVEEFYFGGDMRQYITNDLGIDFDQRNALVVGIAMGFAVIPTIFSMAEDAIFSVPKHLTSGSLALGATQWQTLVKVVLLTASPGIFSAVMMGLGRAVGETMIVLMATGNTPVVDWSIFQGMRTLSANIAVEMPESEVGSSHYRILFLAAFVLFIFTFIFNTVAEFVRQRLREKYSSL